MYACKRRNGSRIDVDQVRVLGLWTFAPIVVAKDVVFITDVVQVVVLAMARLSLHSDKEVCVRLYALDANKLLPR